MTKGADGQNLQFLKHPDSNERLVVIRESQFRALQDAAALGFARMSSDPIEMGALPPDIRHRIAEGESPVRVIREWRGLNGRELASLAGITQSMLSQIERKGKTGSTKTFKAIAAVLGVPLDLVFPDKIQD